MHRRTINPSRRYLAKMRLIMTIVVLLILALVIPLLWLITDDANASSDDSTILYGAAVAANLLWYVPGILLTGPYYRSLIYEIQDDEVIVRAGIWTHSVKHVPYRTVTNLTIKRGILDRWLFGLGSLHIQTAGMSGTVGAEEVLEGLSDVQGVYEIVVKELGRFRGGMAPTTTEMEAKVGTGGTDAGSAPVELDAILVELRAIRHALESR
jgi:membrane protein YdbS with pleckstrin-like domain